MSLEPRLFRTIAVARKLREALAAVESSLAIYADKPEHPNVVRLQGSQSTLQQLLKLKEEEAEYAKRELKVIEYERAVEAGPWC